MTAKKTLSKADAAIFEIIGHHGASYNWINKSLASKGIHVSCLGGKLQNMVMTGMLTENMETGVFRRGLVAPLMLKCLGCGQTFESQGKHNRLCLSCQNRAERIG